MLPIKISADDIALIQRERYDHPQPHLMRRLHILALHHAGACAARIAQLVSRDPRTVRTCLKHSREGGLPALDAYEQHNQECELDPFGDRIEKELEQRPPHRIQEARARIAEWTGITRGMTPITEFLKKRDFVV